MHMQHKDDGARSHSDTRPHDAGRAPSNESIIKSTAVRLLGGGGFKEPSASAVLESEAPGVLGEQLGESLRETRTKMDGRAAQDVAGTVSPRQQNSKIRTKDKEKETKGRVPCFISRTSWISICGFLDWLTESVQITRLRQPGPQNHFEVFTMLPRRHT